MSAKNPVGTSKHDLLLVLRSIGDSDTDKTVELRHAMDDAAEAMKQFRATNKEYLRLEAEESKTSSAFYRHERRHKEERARRIQVIRNAVYVKGACPETVAMVEALMKKYSPTFG